MPTVFISHSNRDSCTIRDILGYLPKQISLWIDENNIVAGESLNATIEDVILNRTDLFLLFLSKDAANSDWVKKELAWALQREQELQCLLIIPILIDDIVDDISEKIKEVGLDLKDRKYLICRDFSKRGIEAFASILTENLIDWLMKEFDRVRPKSQQKDGVDPQEDRMNKAFLRQLPDLWVRISNKKDLWERLENIAIQSVIDGGIAAMGFYKEARRKTKILDKTNTSNPSTLADLQATIAILRTLDSQLLPVCRELECELAYLGEETVYRDLIDNELKYGLGGSILISHDFFAKSFNSIRVIIDAIDGTSNFDRGLPLFCSSLAIFIEGQLRISAIYDPIHHVVFSALLPGSHEDPTKNSKARAWYISAGDDRDLRSSDKTMPPIFDLKKEAIAIHIPRNDKRKRDEFIGVDSQRVSILQNLADEFGGIYALNSGLLALAEVARGGFAGFVNITTNQWDIAAGEVLINACGGKLTDFDGKAIEYQTSKKNGVISARSDDLHSEILRIIKKVTDDQ